MNIILPSSDALTKDPLYARLKERVVESTGLTYYVGKDAEFTGHIRRRLSTAGVHDCASYLGILCDPLRGPSELDALIAEITIGETYFFRHSEHFDALRELVLPGLIARNRSTRRLRIWCAGCADGAEVYSLAILLKRDLARQLSRWEVIILGTDINRRCLARASEGKFEQWALRATPENVKQACFHEDGQYWRIAPEYKEGVSFQYHNLAERSFLPPVNSMYCFDLIVCRNVMIYFGPDGMRRTIRNFYDCLVPGAWLLVGPSEPNMTDFSSFRTVNAPGVTLYQKAVESTPVRLVAETFTAAPLLPSLPPPPQPPEISVKPHLADEGFPPTLADAMRHADRGAWESAAQCCEQLLKRDNLNAAFHFYYALVLGQMKRQPESERSLRRAIYLDHRFVLAHYYLALSLQSRGDSRQAARSFENALDLLRERSNAEMFPEADGITAGELKKLADMNLQILRERE